MTSAEAQHAPEPEVTYVQPVDLLRERHSIRQEVFSKSRKLLAIIAAVVLLSSVAIIPMQIAAGSKRQATARLSNELIVAAANRENAQSQAALVAANEDLLKKHAEEASKTRIWRNLLAELSVRAGSDTWLTGLTCKLESSEASVEIKGTAQTLGNATRFATTLKGSRFFDQARLASTQSTGGPDGGGVTHFECDAILSEAATKGAEQDAPLRFSSMREETEDQE